MSDQHREARDSFGSSYCEARAKFREAASARGLLIESHGHPRHRGPSGEELTVDVAVAGDPSSERALMVISGTHGVEGYAGSACQVGLLRGDLYQELADSVRLILVHAINPFGFAYSRKANEDNVDLNRNFIDFSKPRPTNAAYGALAAQFLPNSPEIECYRAACRRLDKEAVAREGYQFFKLAMQPGQYDDALGLHYGGTKRTWSNHIFMEVCNRHLRKAKKSVVLDVHTGLGASGIGEVIFLEQELINEYGTRVKPPVSCAGSRASVSAAIHGSLLSAAFRLLDSEIKICCALEFGTVALRENIEAKIFENWTCHYRLADDPLRQEGQSRLRDAYFCDNDGWKRSVLMRADEVVRDLHSCLMTD